MQSLRARGRVGMKSTTNPFTGKTNTWKTSLTDSLSKHDFYNGRMISGSKSMYGRNNPNHKVYFNACIFDVNCVQIWYGDLDLTTDFDNLQKVCNETNQIFYVTPENPFRSDFHKITQKDLEKDDYVIKFNPIEEKE